MHKVIPIRCVGECVICYDKTLNKNCCVQCHSCVLCCSCLKRDLQCCPICRKTNFQIQRSTCPKINSYLLSTFLTTVMVFFICFSIGLFVNLVRGKYTITTIDILLHTLLGMILVSSVMALYICFRICVKNL